MSPMAETETADRSGKAKSLVGVSAMMTINQVTAVASIIFLYSVTAYLLIRCIVFQDYLLRLRQQVELTTCTRPRTTKSKNQNLKSKAERRAMHA